MDIWTEQLERRHLPILERWLGRTAGAITPNDLPSDVKELRPWFERCAAEPGRLDCLALVYETPVGVAGLRRKNGRTDTLEVYLMLGEVSYNLRRTAAYVALRMIDHAHDSSLHSLKRLRNSLTVDFPSPVVAAISLLLIPLVKWSVSTLL